MGNAEFDIQQGRLIIHSHIVTYGNAASEEMSEQIRQEIESMWNEPGGSISYRNHVLSVAFRITASFRPDLKPAEIFENTDPRINYFRIEPFAAGNISFVDGIGCNTGYFLLENLYPGSTTAAHEYGHTLGLKHPNNMDKRGQGVPGIMNARGTLVDPQYQYNPEARAGDNRNGGTMHPATRKVLPGDISDLNLHRLDPTHPILGEFSSIWHPDHSDPTAGIPY